MSPTSLTAGFRPRRFVRSVVVMSICSLCVLGSFAPDLAATATPPDLMHYQGVLRDATGAPMSGGVDMVFRFFTAESGGLEIMVDRHLTVNGDAVTVDDGLFSAVLGGGEVLDGSGGGTYTSLADVFRVYDTVWLEIQVEAETLAPRVRILSSAYALNAGSLDGRTSGEFLDVSLTTQTKPGKLILGSSTGTASAYGIEAYGSAAGAYFEDPETGSWARIGVDRNGIQASGTNVGGRFDSQEDGSHAYAAYYGYGIDARGNTAGGYFEDQNDSAYCSVADGDRGVWAGGDEAGGFFFETDGTGEARLAYVDYGVYGLGDGAGGYFEDTNGTGVAYVGRGDTGLQAYGDDRGGYFQDNSSGTYAHVAYGAYKIRGSGTVSFVQNHPEDASRVIVHHAPEASEVAVYTRGSGQLEDGFARVVLDPTFQWTANPDLGLTAHVTPREFIDGSLAVEKVSTTSLLVRGPEGADTPFDFMVWGLRIGFEESTSVQVKTQEAYIPSMEDHRAAVQAEPELAAYTALERFRTQAMQLSGAKADDVDLSNAAALVEKIHEFDPTVDAKRTDLPTGLLATPGTDDGPRAPDVGPAERFEESANFDDGGRESRSRRHGPKVETLYDPGDPPIPAVGMQADGNGAWLLVSSPVQPGQLLSRNEEQPGTFHAADTMGDPGVFGVATGWTRQGDDDHLEVWVTMAGVTEIQVDAGYGVVQPGDMLVASPTPGHAMRAIEVVPGSVVGKAIDGLDAGTGTLRVLLMAR